MYQVGEHEWVCKGRDIVATGYTAGGAYTRWRNLVALTELSSMEYDKLMAQAAQQRQMLTAFPFMVPGMLPRPKPV